MLFSSRSLHLVLGLIIWATWFVLIYMMLSIGCSMAPILSYPLNWINIILFCSMLITLIILLYLMHVCWKMNKSYAKNTSALTSFILWLSLGGYLSAIVATFFIGIMVLFFPPCL